MPKIEAPSRQRDTIRFGDREVLREVPPHVELTPGGDDGGAWLGVETAETSPFWRVGLGRLCEVDRFAACARVNDPFWMRPVKGAADDEVPPDTQWLLVRRTDGKLVLLVPVIDEPLRFSLDGRGGSLAVWGDTGDAETVATRGVAVYAAVGDDPYELQERGARAVAARLGTCRLREDKALPDFVDRFGWCTWDAFYQQVSLENVRRGLEVFREGGVVPGVLILDDGWLSERTMPRGGRRLTGFAAHAEKFPGGLAALKRMLVDEFGVARLLVWHAVMGYWAGLDADAFASYRVIDHVRQTMPSFGKDKDRLFTWFGLTCGAIHRDDVAAFYDDFHRALADEGVDGVKIDNQSSVEYSGTGQGGRVALTRAYRRALEASSRKHFDGRLISCMANASETYYFARDTALQRTSEDFWPHAPESHGQHLHTNAMVSLWFGRFMHPDWDMFQSGHAWGAFHAAARAISGSPIYVSDKVGEHDFDLLRKLVCSDGRVPRCADVALPTPDNVFHDPTREAVPLKLFNRNAHGWVVGVFHAGYDADGAAPIEATVSLDDIPNLPAGDYAVYAHRAERAWPVGERSSTLRVEQGEWEVLTVAPRRRGVAVVGLAEKINSGGCVAEDALGEDGRRRVSLRDAGTLVVVAPAGLSEIRVGGEAVDVAKSTAEGLIRIPVASVGAEVELR